jgi:arylsulfatase A-like enzyme
MNRLPAFPSRLRDGFPTGTMALLVGAFLFMTAGAAGDDDFKGVIGPTDRESTPHYPPPVLPRAASPNIVYVVLDDVGFADLGSYGSEVLTPNLDRLAARGLRYNNFHTRAICSATRAALLTGRNSHAVGMRTVANLQNGFPSGRGRITPAAATLAEVLSSHGYSTFAVGKWHLVPPNDTSAAGPFDHWPTHRGFDRYYGFLDGMTDQYHPDLVQDNTRIEPPNRPGYHLTEDLVDHAIGYVRDQASVTPEKPFFLYLALGAAHAPHQVPTSYVDKYVPIFEKGWDKTRDDRLARQKALGIVPSDTELTAPNDGIKPWDSLSPDEKRLFVRLQAAFAGFLEHADQQLGRLFDHLERTGRLEDTLVVVVSDNGASQEGGFEGTLNELGYFARVEVPFAEKLKRIDQIGTERSFTNYPLGWAQAGNTPFKRYKQNVHGGGSNDPLIISWPGGINDKGKVRTQYVDVIDVTPTVLDIVKIEAPKVHRGVPQLPLHGTSIARTFTDANAPNARHTQYFELHGHRAIWQDGWKAVTYHKPGSEFEDDAWELYDLKSDFSESHDLAARYPDKVEELQKLWWEEAKKYGVLPLDGRNAIGAIRSSRGRPGALSQRSKFTYFPGQEHLAGVAAPDIANRSFSITAYVNRSAAGSEGVILANGDSFGGYTFYLKDGKLAFEINGLLGRSVVVSNAELPKGPETLRVDVTRVSRTEGTAVLTANGQKVGAGKLADTRGLTITWGGLDVGRDTLNPVSPAYADRTPFAFAPGALSKVVFEVQQDETTEAPPVRTSTR